MVTSLTGQPLTLIRPDEAPVYTQLQPGDPGYISPDNIFVLVGSSDFTGVPMRLIPVSAINTYSTIAHTEQGIFTPISAAVSITFDAPFVILPITTVLKVYRKLEIETGKWVEQQVQYYLSENWKTITGFSLTIESGESLTGVIIEYKFD